MSFWYFCLPWQRIAFPDHLPSAWQTLWVDPPMWWWPISQEKWHLSPNALSFAPYRQPVWTLWGGGDRREHLTTGQKHEETKQDVCFKLSNNCTSEVSHAFDNDKVTTIPLSSANASLCWRGGWETGKEGVWVFSYRPPCFQGEPLEIRELPSHDGSKLNYRKALLTFTFCFLSCPWTGWTRSTLFTYSFGRANHCVTTMACKGTIWAISVVLGTLFCASSWSIKLGQTSDH